MKLLTSWAGQLSVDAKLRPAVSLSSILNRDGTSSIAKDVGRLFPPIHTASLGEVVGATDVIMSYRGHTWITQKPLTRGVR